MKRLLSLGPIAIHAAVMILMATPSHAVVTAVDAQASGEVREIIDGSVANTDFAFEDLGETTNNFPLTVLASLQRFETVDEEEIEVSGAQASTTVNDPRLAIDPDPDELGIDLAAFSRVEGVAYDGTCQAIETRDVTLTEDDTNATNGTAVIGSSTFFLDGVLFVWAESGGTDLSGTTSEIAVQVSRLPTGQDPQVVLSTTISLEGQSDGSVVLSATGDVQPQNVVLVDLSNTIPGLGAIHMLLIPNLLIPYAYDATVGEPFQLVAQVDAAIANEPGSGASAVLGLPLDELARLIDEVVPEDVEEMVGEALNEAIENAPEPEVILDGDTTLTPICCGLFGFEAAMMLTLCGVTFLVRSRSRRHGPFRGQGW